MTVKGSRRTLSPPGIGHHQHGSRLSGFGRREAGRGRSPVCRCHQSRYAYVELVAVGGVLAPTSGFETGGNGNLLAFVVARGHGRLAEERRGMCKWTPVDGEVDQPRGMARAW